MPQVRQQMVIRYPLWLRSKCRWSSYIHIYTQNIIAFAFYLDCVCWDSEHVTMQEPLYLVPYSLIYTIKMLVGDLYFYVSKISLCAIDGG
jgi:hypothetical protein